MTSKSISGFILFSRRVWLAAGSGICCFCILLGNLHAQNTVVTAPVGYRTETITPGVFNLLSSNLSNALSASGEIDSFANGNLTDTGVDFTSLLGGGNWVVEIVDGAAAGRQADIVHIDRTILHCTPSIPDR